jgi:hypothetical protein
MCATSRRSVTCKLRGCSIHHLNDVHMQYSPQRYGAQQLVCRPTRRALSVLCHAAHHACVTFTGFN